MSTDWRSDLRAYKTKMREDARKEAQERIAARDGNSLDPEDHAAQQAAYAAQQRDEELEYEAEPTVVSEPEPQSESEPVKDIFDGVDFTEATKEVAGDSHTVAALADMIAASFTCKSKIRQALDGLDIEALNMTITSAQELIEYKELEQQRKLKRIRAGRHQKAKIHLNLWEVAGEDQELYLEFCADVGLKPETEEFLIEALNVIEEKYEDMAARPVRAIQPTPGIRTTGTYPSTDYSPRKTGRRISDEAKMLKYKFFIFDKDYYWSGYGRKPNALRAWLAKGNNLNDAKLPREEWMAPWKSQCERNNANSVSSRHRADFNALVRLADQNGIR